jgi:hypothetical protein
MIRRRHIPDLSRSAAAGVEAVLPDHPGWSRWFDCGGDFDCVQLIWTDRDGCFPVATPLCN